MHPITFVRTHPVATIVLFASGMIVGPWLLGQVNSRTGVSIGLPTVGGGGE